MACSSIGGCVSAPAPRATYDNYGCLMPQPNTLSSIGIEASISGGILSKIIPNISVKVDPKVIETGSKASKDLEMSRYVTCTLMNQYNIPPDRALPVFELLTFFTTSPTSEQFMKYVNDRPSLKQIVTVVNDDKPFSGQLNGRRIYVDAVRNGSSSRDGWAKGQKITLQAGNWEVKPVGGGWSAWRRDNSAPPNVKGAWTWSMYVTMDNNTNEVGSFSWLYKNSDEANAAASSIESLKFSLDKPADVFFWIFDVDGTEDNRGVLVVDVIRKSL